MTVSDPDVLVNVEIGKENTSLTGIVILVDHNI